MGGRGGRKTDVTLNLSHHHIIPRVLVYNSTLNPWELKGRNDNMTLQHSPSPSHLTGTLRGGLVDMMAAPLLKAKTLKCGQKVVKIEERPGTAKVTVTLASGKSHEADLVCLPLLSHLFVRHNVQSRLIPARLSYTLLAFSFAGGGRRRH